LSPEFLLLSFGSELLIASTLAIGHEAAFVLFRSVLMMPAVEADHALRQRVFPKWVLSPVVISHIFLLNDNSAMRLTLVPASRLGYRRGRLIVTPFSRAHASTVL
jgi:hypothetical protein